MGTATSARRLYHVAGGVMLVVVSAFSGWLPVLGWGTAIVGVAMIAAEFYPVAHLMDRPEVRAWRMFNPRGKVLAR